MGRLVPTISIYLLLCGILSSQVCPVGTVIIQTQADLDVFVAAYPSCTELPADLLVLGSTDIENLDQLNFVESIAGSLVIRNNQVLTNIVGVSNIDVRRSVIISRNWVLEKIKGFNGIDSLDRIEISQNHQMDTVAGFAVLEYADTLEILRHDLLEVIPSFNNMIEVGELNFSSNDSVRSITGFEILMKIKRSCFISGASLALLNGFNEVKKSGSITLSTGVGFSEIEVFNAADTIGQLGLGSIIQSGTVNIFQNVTTCFAGVQINGYLGGDLNGFKKLRTMGPFALPLSIFNSNFADLDFLSNLTEVSGFRPRIQLGNNPNLTDISGLDGINPDSIGRLRITGNSSLSICHSELICDILDRDDVDEVDIEISDNATGCNSVEAIQEQCDLKVDDPDPTLCPMTARPGMQINRLCDERFDVLYSYGGKQMMMTEISNEAVLEMIDHFMVEKYLQFEFEFFELEQLCARAEKIASGNPYVRPASPSNLVTLARFEEVYSEVSYFQSLSFLIDIGDCVKI